MRRTVHISGKIEPFFGTLDENVRLLEDSLHVRTHLHDTRLTIEGDQESVDQAVKIVEEYNHLTRHGRSLSSTEVKTAAAVGYGRAARVSTGDVRAGTDASVWKKASHPEKREPEALHGRD